MFNEKSRELKKAIDVAMMIKLMKHFNWTASWKNIWFGLVCLERGKVIYERSHD